MSTTFDLSELAAQASRDLEGAPALEIMRWAYAEFGSGLVVTSSMVDTVMIHLAEQVAPGIDVIFLDTGYHFVETIGTRDAAALVHDVNVINVTPEQTVAEQDATWGKDLFARDPTAAARCARSPRWAPRCGRTPRGPVGSVAPTPRPGRRRPVVSWDAKRQLVKVAPIATWSDDGADGLRRQHQLMLNPLLEDGYASIGCEPCTVRASGPDARAGRWAGLAKTECGIHL